MSFKEILHYVSGGLVLLAIASIVFGLVGLALWGLFQINFWAGLGAATFFGAAAVFGLTGQQP